MNLYLCTCLYMTCTCMCMYICLWRPENKPNYHSSGAINLDFFVIKSLTGLGLTKQARLAGCPVSPRDSLSHLHFPIPLIINTFHYAWSLKCKFWAWNLCFHVCKGIILLRDPSSSAQIHRFLLEQYVMVTQLLSLISIENPSNIKC